MIRVTGEERFQDFASSYDVLYGKEAVRQVVRKNSIKKFSPSGCQGISFLRPVLDFYRFVRANFSPEELLGVYLHGSLGAMDFVEGYSDFDALFIVRQEIFKEDRLILKVKEKITRANTFLYLLDPLQHHNAFVICEADMQYYYETIFPTVLFDYACEVTDFHQELVFRCLNSEKYLEELFLFWEHVFDAPAQYGLDLPRVYSIKHAAQSIAFLPAAYLQAKTKQFMFKKFTFAGAKKDFPETDWAVIERVTKLRDTYSFKSFYPYHLRKWCGMNLHYKYLQILHRFLDRNRPREMLAVLGDQYLDEARQLIKKMKTALYGNERDSKKLYQ